MSDAQKRTKSEKAVVHVLRALVDDPRKFDLLGHGTESWNLLSQAFAEVMDLDPAEVKGWGPEGGRWERYLEERERNQRVIDQAEEYGIPSSEIIELTGYEGCECAADADDPGAYLKHLACVR
jgi:hypothetical protein